MKIGQIFSKGLERALIFQCALCLSHAQVSKHASTRPSPLIAPCSSFGNAKSCQTFNEMVRSHDSDLDGLEKYGSSFVCFRTDVDNFFAITYFPLPKRAFASAPTEALESGITQLFNFSDYLNGQDNGSEFRIYKWGWIKGLPESSYVILNDESKPKYGIQDLTISDSSVHFTRNFQNVRDQEVTQTIDIRKSTLRFSLEIDSGGDHDLQSGHCVKFPR